MCMSIFFKGTLKGPHHQDRQSLTAAAKNGCKMCLHINSTPEDEDLDPPLEYVISWDRSNERHYVIEIRTKSPPKHMPIWNRWTFYVNTSGDAKAPPGYDEFLDLVTADLASDPCRVRSEFPPLRDIPDNTGHGDVAKLAKQWLENCKTDHECELLCGQQDKSWHPKRLIDVGFPHEPPRLVTREDDQLEGSYVALSHCWGQNPNFLMLKTDKESEFRKEIPMDQLPASFRDAVITCRRLDIRYIWIDSLCIIQDSHSDWLFHSEEMFKVYLNCELNIAIEASANAHEGAFRERDPTFLQDCYLWTPFFTPQPHDTQYFPSTDEFKSSGRGFDAAYVARYNIRENGSLLHFYAELVDEYTSRELTFPVTDKLVAFAAVATRCASWFKGDYCAGIFRDTMPWGLLWQIYSPRGGARSQTWRAPSWSWASMDCSVRLDLFPKKQKTDLAKMVDVSVELVDPNNQFGQVKSASLTLTGPLVSIEALVFSDCQTVQKDPPRTMGRETGISVLGHHFELTPDENFTWDDDPDQKTKTQGLMVLS
ncbi:hypothetical protein CEP52_000988 [Fusarium oligoseptatum]|uniref:Heterokaryon incompatibility domain-containing protein n=1 Tax=Fusarium oligoseptatum TaxID=2604345 RepID=A0A428UKX1_9HYPO|nr:hypothetical protein CEP52_000988 [Fusarium oligoseptatum]